jgi:hypothetical protein
VPGRANPDPGGGNDDLETEANDDLENGLAAGPNPGPLPWPPGPVPDFSAKISARLLSGATRIVT